MKKIELITISAMLVLSSLLLSPASSQAALIAYYPFSGNANDASGNNRNGTASGVTLTADRFGNANSAYNFNGTNGFIQLPPFAMGPTFSFSGWLKVNNAAQWSRFFDFANGPASNNLVVAFENGNLVFHTYNGATWSGATTPSAFPIGTWVHVVAINDGAGTSAIYLNGSLAVLAGSQQVALAMARTNQYIGRSNWAADPYFNGAMDEIRIFDHALGATEVQSLYISADSLTVTASATDGTATPASQTVYYGLPTTVTGTANTGYYFTGASGCGATPLINSNQKINAFNYTTGAITDNCAVTATYDTCTTASCGRGGFSQEISYGLPAILEASYLIQNNNNTASYGPPEAQVELTKSLPFWNYPLRYLHTVDYGPFEELIKVPNPRPGVSACVDSAAAAAPTCGWQLDGAGQRIADSQGFCTNRSLLDLKNEADPTALLRGEELTGRSTVADPFAIAHCLRLNGVSYRGYEIGNPVRDYEVDVRVLEGAAVKTFKLTPEAPLYQDSNAPHLTRAELVGEKPLPPENLSGDILYIPSAPANDPKVINWQDNMLLVPRRLVSPDGGECDRVGTSYRAFRGERTFADATRAGACLGNQLRQLLEADQARLLGNPAAESEYLVKNKRLFRGSQVHRSDALLRLPSPEVAYSTVDLEVVPAITEKIENEAMAWIRGASADPFVAFSRHGEMKVTIDNVGLVDASYRVNVHGCTAGSESSPSQGVRIPFKSTRELFFPLRSGVVGTSYCHLTLESHTGKTMDSVKVLFSTGAADAFPPGRYLPNNNSRISGVTP